MAGGSSFSGYARFTPSQQYQRSSGVTGTPKQSRATQKGIGLGGKGLGKGKGAKRHKKVLRDNIQSVTKGDIRRLARRGGVKRISAMIYDDVRHALKQRLQVILRDIVAIVEYSGRQTVTVRDVIFTLNRIGQPIYGFDASYTRER
ncbi:histone-fold-containing protein [Lophiotrema nucula]|uniref:Histone H4 n=1 Tax=Lophiotrema nucula TaxID=690887 RepID=A0A6A5ZQN4_9PLEO|nr:histone-fold-containing protein [Lophiotrema nucula]